MDLMSLLTPTTLTTHKEGRVHIVKHIFRQSSWLPRLAIALTFVLAVLWSLHASVGHAASSDSTSTNYIVAFNQQSSLPTNVDQMVANAGGTITVRLPEIGGIGVSSSNPNF